MTTSRSIDPGVRIRARQILAVTLASFALAGGVQAQSPRTDTTPARQGVREPQMSGETDFLRADTDKDGKISKAEAAPFGAIAERFVELDRNKDGFLSVAEFVSAYNPGAAPTK